MDAAVAALVGAGIGALTTVLGTWLHSFNRPDESGSRWPSISEWLSMRSP